MAPGWETASALAFLYTVCDHSKMHPRLQPLIPHIQSVDVINRAALMGVFEDHGDVIAQSPGSSGNHQAWPGGFVDHLLGMIEVSFPLWRPHLFPGVTWGDFVLTTCLHDIEKPWKYVTPPAGSWVPASPTHLIERYGFKLSEVHVNALKYAHGEGNDYRKDVRVMSPLAALLHICDIYSARIEWDRRILPV